MSDNAIELSRRKLLASAGAIGVAGAGAGLGTSAFFSDDEQFGNNSLAAGELDVRVAWESYYSDWSADESKNLMGDVQMEGGSAVDGDRVGLPADDAALVSVASEADARSFLENTRRGVYPDGYDPTTLPDNPCSNGALGDADASPPAIDITDVKPGDFGGVTFDFALCDNPGFVWLRGRLTDASENDRTEPEAESDGEQNGVVELLDAVRAAAWVDTGDTRSIQENGESLAFSGSLRNVLNGLAAGEGLGLSGDTPAEAGGGQGRNCFSAETLHSVVLVWWVPTEVGNDIQTDSVTFEVGLYAEQCRHNSASGTGRSYLPQSKLFPVSGSADDEYGRAVAVDGDTAMVGAPNGSVYVLRRSEGTWAQETVLSTGDDSDEFGTSLALDGDSDAALISAPGADEAYVYTRTDEDGSGGWTEAATLTPSDEPTSIGYETVALSGDTAVVSGYDDAYVYERSSSWPDTMEESTQLSTDDGLPAAGLAVDGDTLLIGAPAVTNFRSGGAGTVYVYDLSGSGSPTVDATLEPAVGMPEALQDFGASVALNGDTAFVGAPRAGESGATHVYDRGPWDRIASLSASDAASEAGFGRTVTVAGQTALIGAPGDDGSAVGSGAAYIFDGDGGWSGTESQQLVPTDGDDGDRFGSGLALNGDTAFVGAREGDGAADDSGAVYVFSNT